MGRKVERIYTYDGKELNRNELLQKPEILNYLRRDGIEKDRESLHNRFYREFKKGDITKEIALGFERRSKKKTRSKRKKYLYGDEFLSRDELLQRPEVLKYLRRNSKEKNETGLYKRFYKAIKMGNLTKEIVLGLKQKVRGRPKKVIQGKVEPNGKEVQRPKWEELTNRSCEPTDYDITISTLSVKDF